MAGGGGISLLAGTKAGTESTLVNGDDPMLSPLGEHAGHIEVEGHEPQRYQKHGDDKDHHGRHLISRVTGPATKQLTGLS